MHTFTGKWITNEEFSDTEPRNVFCKQLDNLKLPCEEHRNRHILFRKKFVLSEEAFESKIYISADDYYKLYINGKFVGQGPAPSYHHRYNYNVIDITEFLVQGENNIAVHTLYQGLINRVWQSGDNRHGLILDLVVNGKTVVASDDTFKTKVHTGFREMGTVGYDTQFMEEYDTNASEVGFEAMNFDDLSWENARLRKHNDYVLVEQKTSMLVSEKICPTVCEKNGNVIKLDFGSNFVGYLYLKVSGRKDDTVIIRCGQELNENGSVRYELRANCVYEERWILSDGESALDQFDYKSFRYAEIVLPENCVLEDAYMVARHYPFALKADIREKYKNNARLKKIWDLCVHTQEYGVQEVIQDCMDREKGFYMGDGCYTALTNMVLTKDDSMVRKLIDDGFATSFITEGLVTCMDCSFMQEIAEYPLMLIFLVLWHYRFTEDRAYLRENYPKVVSVLEAYRRDYEHDGLLRKLDKWCVVEWPKNYQDGYDVDVLEGKICEDAHVSINAYYIEAIKTANKIAAELDVEPYRDEKPLTDAFLTTFYDSEKNLFKDGENTNHISIVGNSFPFGFGLCTNDKFVENVVGILRKRKLSSVSFFCAFPLLMGILRYGMEDEIENLMEDKGAWLRMLDEGATTTFEGWGKDTKWNTSLFHLTMSYGALFLADADIKKLLD